MGAPHRLKFPRGARFCCCCDGRRVRRDVGFILTVFLWPDKRADPALPGRGRGVYGLRDCGHYPYSGQGKGLLISKLRAVLGAAILIVATSAVAAIVVPKWNPFPPKDYEDCAARAAKDAKSKDALSVLLSICGSEFEGRRKAGGGYTYYDSCQDRAFDIQRAKPDTRRTEAHEGTMFHLPRRAGTTRGYGKGVRARGATSSTGG